ncbi:MAG: hypothetical protein AAF514_17510, partial [Verrucomicrobiota bacterium]
KPKPFLHLIVFLSMTSSILASNAVADNLLYNGDFEKNKTRWKGEGRIINPGKENKAMSLKVHRKNEPALFQRFKNRNLRPLEVTFRYKFSKDIDRSSEIIVKLIRPNGSYSWKTIQTKEDQRGKWSTYRWSFKDLQKAKEMTLCLSVKPGRCGIITFDDIVVSPQSP